LHYCLGCPGGSFGCAVNSPIVQKAALTLKSKILELVAPTFDVTADELDIKNDSVYVIADPSKTKTIVELFKSLGLRHFPLTAAVDSMIAPGTHKPPYNCWQAHFCELKLIRKPGKLMLLM
jgi:hypothetical protein